MSGASSTRVLIASLAASPAAWAVELIVGYGVAGWLCYPGAAPRTPAPAQGWGVEQTALLALILACLAIAVGAGLVSLRAWRSGSLDPPQRFLAGCGVLAAAGFAIAIVFNAMGLIGTPTCWRYSP